MINLFLKFKSKKFNSKNISLKDIAHSNKILFSIFTRYGDTLIDLIIIKEFISKYPNKEYLIMTPPQMEPFVKYFLPNISSYSINKRNPWKMFRVNKILKNWAPDLAFNPWSNGLDSCYFLSYAKKYFCYRDFFFNLPINHYDVVRKYLQLPFQESKSHFSRPKNLYKHVLICPDSTDKERSIRDDELISIIEKIYKKFNPSITIASMNKKGIRGYNFLNIFKFQKTQQSSADFLKVMINSDLIISADSAPLHLALALKKDTCALFKTTKRDLVVNNNSFLIRYDEI